MKSPVEAALRNIVRDPDRVRPQEPLAPRTTFRIGGPAEFLVEVHTMAELLGVLEVVTKYGLPLHILGNGSNVLVPDEGVPGVVLVLGGELAGRRIEGTRVVAGGGCNLPRLAVEVSRMGLGGLHFACAIPGTVGAGLVINAGAHGGEMSQVVAEAEVVWPEDGRVERLRPEEIGFGYRTSRLLGTSAVVTEVVFDLYPADRDELAARIKELLERRKATQPLGLPNAGSIFRNPPGDYAGRLIEAAGCKGWRVGDAQVSEKHANFIVNLGRATARDVIALALKVRDAVESRFGVRLEPEVRIWGPNPFR